jgi:hypothetical protein
MGRLSTANTIKKRMDGDGLLFRLTHFPPLYIFPDSRRGHLAARCLRNYGDCCLNCRHNWQGNQRMKCPKCHLDNPSDSKFCAECGTRITPAPPSSPDKPEPVVFTETLQVSSIELTRGSTFASRFEVRSTRRSRSSSSSPRSPPTAALWSASGTSSSSPAASPTATSAGCST